MTTTIKIQPSQIINNQDGNLTTTSLIIAEAFDKRHNDVIRAIENLSYSEEFSQRNFASSDYTNERGKKYHFYTLTEKGFLILALGFTGEKANAWQEAFINAFEQMRDQLKQPVPIENLSRLEILQLAMKSEQENQHLAEQNQAMSADVQALERIAKADGSMCITNTAKDLQMRPKDLFNWLSTNKWIYKRAGNGGWIGYQDKIQQLLLEHKITVVYRSDGSEKTIEQVRVTNKGLTKLSLFIKNSLVINEQATNA